MSNVLNSAAHLTYYSDPLRTIGRPTAPLKFLRISSDERKLVRLSNVATGTNVITVNNSTTSVDGSLGDGATELGQQDNAEPAAETTSLLLTKSSQNYTTPLIVISTLAIVASGSTLMESLVTPALTQQSGFIARALINSCILIYFIHALLAVFPHLGNFSVLELFRGRPLCKSDFPTVIPSRAPMVPLLVYYPFITRWSWQEISTFSLSAALVAMLTIYGQRKSELLLI